MTVSSIDVTVDEELLREIDRLIDAGFFPDRGTAIREALEEKVKRLEKARLALQCAQLDIAEEQAMAEEGFCGEIVKWPEY
ncbi:MAG: ribbon-helix-helix domain-containing protein [Synergistales bacterium]|nr:ribbon-helix-helix domain-containing protein [Synergistales bacterium]